MRYHGIPPDNRQEEIECLPPTPAKKPLTRLVVSAFGGEKLGETAVAGIHSFAEGETARHWIG
jgi:hypothetical protein